MRGQFVLDASVAVGWLLAEEQAAVAWAVADRFRSEDALVPPNWSLEVCNAVRKAVRTGRITVDTQTRLQQIVLSFPIRFDPPSIERDWMTIVPLAHRLELSTYDAAYLELAMRCGVPLATLDDQLRQRASELGIETV